MIYSGINGYMGAALPHQELLSGTLGALPHQELLNGRQSTIFQTSEFAAYQPISPTSPATQMLLGAYNPISPVAPVWMDLDEMATQLGFPPGFVKDIGKGIAKGAKAAGGAVADAAKGAAGAVAGAATFAGKGLMAAGKFMVKIGGKVLDLALLPFDVALRISLKIGDIVCALPPQTMAMAASAASTSMGAPVPPGQADALRDTFCNTLATVKKSGIKNIKDFTKLSKMVPVMMKIATEAPKVMNSMQASAANAGVEQRMQQAGASPQETAAAGQLAVTSEVEGLLDAAAGEMKNFNKNVGKAFKQGEKAANTLLKNPNMLKAATAMMQNMAAGAVAAGAGQPPEEAAAAAPAKAVKIDPTVKRLQDEIRQFKILGRMDLVAKVTPRLNAAIQASLQDGNGNSNGNMAGYMGAAGTKAKWGYGLLLLGGAAAAGLGIYAVTRGPRLPVLY